MIRGFGSDNFSGVLPEVFKALEEAAYGHQHSYEEDVYSEKAIQDFKNVFGENIRVFFVYNGTGQTYSAYLPSPIPITPLYVPRPPISMWTNAERSRNNRAVNY